MKSIRLSLIIILFSNTKLLAQNNAIWEYSSKLLCPTGYTLVCQISGICKKIEGVFFGSRVDFDKNVVQIMETNQIQLKPPVLLENIITNKFNKFDRMSIGYDESTLYFFPEKIFNKNGKKYIPTILFNAAIPDSSKEISLQIQYKDCEIISK